MTLWIVNISLHSSLTLDESYDSNSLGLFISVTPIFISSALLRNLLYIAS